MTITISQDELHPFCTAISLINGGFRTKDAVLDQTERLFGSAGLAAMLNAFHRYSDGPIDLWSLNGTRALVVNVTELLLPEYGIVERKKFDFPDIIE